MSERRNTIPGSARMQIHARKARISNTPYGRKTWPLVVPQKDALFLHNSRGMMRYDTISATSVVCCFRITFLGIRCLHFSISTLLNYVAVIALVESKLKASLPTLQVVSKVHTCTISGFTSTNLRTTAERLIVHYSIGSLLFHILLKLRLLASVSYTWKIFIPTEPRWSRGSMPDTGENDI